MWWGVHLSRWINRMILGRDEMLSSRAEWHRWRVRHAINAVFRIFGQRDHCGRAADWESLQDREETYLDRLRRDGTL